MKPARQRPIEADFKAARKLLGWICAINADEMPCALAKQPGERISTKNTKQYRQLVKGLKALNANGEVNRILFAAMYMCDPANQIINPDADTLELHPRIKRALEAQEGASA